MHHLNEHIDTIDWLAVAADLHATGMAPLPALLTPGDCEAVKALWDQPTAFRSKVVMGHHNFGEGEYQYFANPLPPLVLALRQALYPRLAPIANVWAERLGLPGYPDTLEAFTTACAFAGQTKPTPLLLRYEAGGYNCLHQDLYGQLAFPLQAVFLLDQPGVDFSGGEFLLVEQRPRAQSAAEVATLQQGDGLVFTTRYRPVAGTRGYYRVNVRHGVSRVHSGHRHTLGVIFHDAG